MTMFWEVFWIIVLVVLVINRLSASLKEQPKQRLTTKRDGKQKTNVYPMRRQPVNSKTNYHYEPLTQDELDELDGMFK
jgi:hypothetical protein